MKRILSLIIAVFTCSAVLFAQQAKKPKLMVVPSDAWCIEKGYVQTYDNMGMTQTIPNYSAALSNKELNNVISKLNVLMADRAFPMQNLGQTIKSINNISAEDMLITSSTSGAAMTESPLDRVRRVAKADIILEIDWTLNSIGPRNSITYNLKALDVYSNKQVAGAQGTGTPSLTTDIPLLLEEAILENMDNFATQLMAHFEDIMNNGREVVIDVRVFDNGSGINLETDYNGYELGEIIENWMAENTVNHVFNKADGTENFIMFDQVRIPAFKSNGMAQDTEGFTRDLMRFLRAEPYKLTCKVLNRGLGRCLLIIGEK
ncbi:MAG: hypothetical protein IIW66_00300 [Bacteroidales bacterium]|nr:hypothetical protein [Bacteroidales bacterium]